MRPVTLGEPQSVSSHSVTFVADSTLLPPLTSPFPEPLCNTSTFSHVSCSCLLELWPRVTCGLWEPRSRLPQCINSTTEDSISHFSATWELGFFCFVFFFFFGLIKRTQKRWEVRNAGRRGGLNAWMTDFPKAKKKKSEECPVRSQVPEAGKTPQPDEGWDRALDRVWETSSVT